MGCKYKVTCFDDKVNLSVQKQTARLEHLSTWQHYLSSPTLRHGVNGILDSLGIQSFAIAFCPIVEYVDINGPQWKGSEKSK